MEFQWSDDDARFRSQLREFVASELPARWQDLVPGEEPASQFIVEFCRKLGEKGWLTPHWPREYGGTDASAWQFIILGEQISSQFVLLMFQEPACLSPIGPHPEAGVQAVGSTR